MCAHTHTCTYICAQTHSHTNIHTHTHINVRAYTYMHIHMRTDTLAHKHGCTHKQMCVHTYKCVHRHTHKCVYTHSLSHTHTQALFLSLPLHTTEKRSLWKHSWIPVKAHHFSFLSEGWVIPHPSASIGDTKRYYDTRCSRRLGMVIFLSHQQYWTQTSTLLWLTEC